MINLTMKPTACLPSIVLCDDHELFLNGIKDILFKSEKFNVKKLFTCSSDCVKYLGEHEPDILITDLNIDTQDGFAIAKEVKNRELKTSVVILSAYEEPFLVEKARKMGVSAYLSKNTSSKELLNALLNTPSSAFNTNIGDTVKDGFFESVDAQFTGQYRLSEKETRVIKLVLQGKTSQEISETLFISKHTVDTHRRNVYKKLGISGFVSLQQFARKNGIA